MEQYEYSRNAVKILADKAYEFFKNDYKSNTGNIQNIITNYSVYLVKAQMAYFHYKSEEYAVQENIIKPLNCYYNQLFEWVFETLRNAIITDFPNRNQYIDQAIRLYNDDTSDLKELRNVQCKVIAGKLLSEFVVDLYQAVKLNYKTTLKTDFFAEYKFFIDSNKDGLDQLWNELYGRVTKIIVDCLRSMGLQITDDIKNYIYGNLIVLLGDGADMSMIDTYIAGNVNLF